ncbi:MAG: class I SAM-dependent methyltransferase [Candidatus Moraniibacteriota bacterium]
MTDYLKLWNESVEAYDGYGSTFSQYEDTSRFLVEVAGIRPGQTVVDLACGTGITTRHILDRVTSDGRVYAVDFSSVMLEKAKQNIRDENVTYIVSRAEDVADVMPEKVDVVVCNSAFWQFDDYERVFASVASLLKRDGIFVFDLNQQFYDFGPTEESHRKRVMEFISSELARRGYPTESRLREKLKKEHIVKLAQSSGYSLPLTETLEIPGSTIEDTIRFLRIPAVAPFFEGVPDTVRDDILDTIYRILKDDAAQIPKNRWIAFVFRADVE